jgi:hypothetical protein
MKSRGQVLILVAVLIPIGLLLLAIAVDAGRIFIERTRLQRSAQAAADAGISVVAEQMVTLAVARQTQLASTPSPTPPGTMTATPLPGEIQAWLTNEDRQALSSNPLRGTAEAEARAFAIHNGADPDRPEIKAFEIQFPQPGYDPEDTGIRTLRFIVNIERELTVLLAGLLGESFIQIDAVGQSEIPQR